VDKELPPLMRRLEPFYLPVTVNKNECSGIEINQADVAIADATDLNFEVLAISMLFVAYQSRRSGGSSQTMRQLL
jgi:hypothetical protein